MSKSIFSSGEPLAKPLASRVFDRDARPVFVKKSEEDESQVTTRVSWENVPGVLSSSGGRDFGAFLGALAQLGYGFAYRVLDAQNFGVPQRRRRVFVVGHLGDWRRATAVLFERPRLSRSTQESEGQRKEPPCFTPSSFGNWRIGVGTIRAQAGHVRTDLTIRNGLVSKLTPLECERLQGMPDNWTLIPGAKDSHRYKAIGNSMAVPVMRWIGEGIAAVNLE